MSQQTPLDVALEDVRDRCDFLQANQHHGVSMTVLSLLGRVMDLLAQAARRLTEDIEAKNITPVGITRLERSAPTAKAWEITADEHREALAAQAKRRERGEA